MQLVNFNFSNNYSREQELMLMLGEPASSS